MTFDMQIKGFFGAIETLDLDRAVSFFSPSARLYFCGTLVASGRPAIRRFLLPLFTCLDAFRHETIAIWSQSGVSVVEGDVQFSSVGGGHQVMPVTSVLHWSRERIEECRVSTWREMFPRIHAA